MIDHKNMEHIQPTILEKTKEILERDFYWDTVEVENADRIRFDTPFGSTLWLNGDGTIEGMDPYPALKRTLISLGWDLK